MGGWLSTATSGRSEIFVVLVSEVSVQNSTRC